jgi:hypothetical protein
LKLEPILQSCGAGGLLRSHKGTINGLQFLEIVENQKIKNMEYLVRNLKKMFNQ